MEGEACTFKGVCPSGLNSAEQNYLQAQWQRWLIKIVMMPIRGMTNGGSLINENGHIFCSHVPLLITKQQSGAPRRLLLNEALRALEAANGLSLIHISEPTRPKR